MELEVALTYLKKATEKVNRNIERAKRLKDQERAKRLEQARRNQAAKTRT